MTDRQIYIETTSSLQATTSNSLKSENQQATFTPCFDCCMKDACPVEDTSYHLETPELPKVTDKSSNVDDVVAVLCTMITSGARMATQQSVQFLDLQHLDQIMSVIVVKRASEEFETVSQLRERSAKLLAEIHASEEVNGISEWITWTSLAFFTVMSLGAGASAFFAEAPAAAATAGAEAGAEAAGAAAADAASAAAVGEASLNGAANGVARAGAGEAAAGTERAALQGGAAVERGAASAGRASFEEAARGISDAGASRAGSGTAVNAERAGLRAGANGIEAEAAQAQQQTQALTSDLNAHSSKLARFGRWLYSKCTTKNLMFAIGGSITSFPLFYDAKVKSNIADLMTEIADIQIQAGKCRGETDSCGQMITYWSQSLERSSNTASSLVEFEKEVVEIGTEYLRVRKQIASLISNNRRI